MEIIMPIIICYFFCMFKELIYDPSDGKYMSEEDKQKENERIKKQEEYKKHMEDLYNSQLWQ